MELRSHNHLHFIQAIKGGSIKRVLNVDARARPTLKVRKLEDIYKKEILKHDELLPKIQPRVVMDFDHMPDMPRGSCLLAAEATIKNEPEDCDVDLKGSADNRDGNSDDLGFVDMTLEQIRKQCKANKRKRQNHTYNLTANSDSQVKEDYLIFQPEDDGCDLEEPLCNLKSKFSKRRKGKKERKVKCGSASSPAMRKEDLLASCDVKLELCEHSHPVCEAMTFIPTDSLAGNMEEPSSTRMESNEARKTTNPVEDVMNVSTEQAQSDVSEASFEFQDSTSVVNKVAFENQESINPETFSDASVPGEESTMTDSSEGSSPQNSDSPIAESGDDICVNCPVSSNASSESEAAYEHGESIDPKPDFGKNVTGWEIVKIESPEILAMEYSGFPVLDFGEESRMIWGLSCNFSFKTGCLARNYQMDRNLLMCSSAYHATLLASPRSQVQELDVDHIDHGLRCLDLNTAESSSEAEDAAKDYVHNIPEVTAISQSTSCCDAWDNSCSGSVDCMISVDEDHLLAKRRSASSGHTDAAGDNKSERTYNASGGVTTASETYSVQHKKLHRLPEKLFSGRKVISPASQEKLRKALEHLDSPEKKSNKCKGKLYFSSQNAHRILKAEGLDNIERIEVTPNTKQTIQKPNNFRHAQHQKGTSKTSRNNIEVAAPRFSTGCTSIQGCSQSAIAFSQRQMRDIQSLAAKLTNELSGMKEIMKGCLQTEGSPSKLSKCKMDEVKIAIGNAGRAEETARKWLSMMERDCNRFCKLMGMIQEGSSTSENVAQKKKKKITFADDAGGDLCHVRFFENDIASSSQSAL